MMGGRTNHWGRISLRNGPYDFKPRSRDGLGFDWPIGYDDLEPYYTKVEMLIGVYGTNEGLENTPNSPPGVLLPAPKGRAAELLAQKHGKRLGIPVVSIHRAVLTTHLDYRNIPEKASPRQPLGAEDCSRVNGQSVGLLLGHAVRPGMQCWGQLSVNHRSSSAGPGHRKSRHYSQWLMSAK